MQITALWHSNNAALILTNAFRGGQLEGLPSKCRHFGVLLSLSIREGPAELQKWDKLLLKGKISPRKASWTFGTVTHFLHLSQGSGFADLLWCNCHYGRWHRWPEGGKEAFWGWIHSSWCPGGNSPAIVSTVLISLSIFHYLMELLRF